MITMTCTKAVPRSRRVSIVLPSEVPVGEADFTVVIQPQSRSAPRQGVTGRQLLRSPLLGLWRNRHDIGDSVAFAAKLRAKNEKRTHGR